MKVWMIVAASLVALGLIVFTVAFAITGFQFKEFEMRKCTQNTHTVTESFSNVSIVTDTADIDVLPSPDGQVRVECLERPKELHTVLVTDGTLTITLNDTRAWYDYLSFFSITSPKITVYLPAGEYGNLTVKASTGDIHIAKDFTFANADVSVSTGDVHYGASAMEDLTIKASTGNIEIDEVNCVGAVSLRVSTGKTKISALTCKELTSTGTTGDLSMENVTVIGLMSLKRDTGDINFVGCDAAEIVIHTSTGDVKGSFRTDKIVWAKTDTGHVEVPKSTAGGRCEIRTDTGDIHIETIA